MKIIPAIDLINGKCVRLLKGDYDKVTEYGNPIDMAIEFEKEGAKYLHLVDLDGALKGNVVNENVVKEILSKTNLEVELGGGIRSVEDAKKWLDLGVYRVILGSIAIKDINVVKELVNIYGPKRIIVGLDASNGYICIHGWKEKTNILAKDFVYKLKNIGVEEIIYTDIAKDGALEGINVAELDEMVKTGINVVASGGVTTLDDLTNAKKINCVGIIIGKAIYNGNISVYDAVRCE